MAARYPGAIWRPSPVKHDKRPDTLGVCVHWTAGHERGDVATLTGGSVDCHFYVAKDGDVYQFLELDSKAWHAKSFANTYSIGIETEGFGEAWTPAQFNAMVRLSAWIVRQYPNIPVRHVDPSGYTPSTFRGFFGHRDLSLGGVRVDGNDHTDTVPAGTGWDRYLNAIKRELNPVLYRYHYYFQDLTRKGANWGPYKTKAARAVKMAWVKMVRPSSVLRTYNKKERIS